MGGDEADAEALYEDAGGGDMTPFLFALFGAGCVSVGGLIGVGIGILIEEVRPWKSESATLRRY